MVCFFEKSYGIIICTLALIHMEEIRAAPQTRKILTKVDNFKEETDL